MTQLLFAEPVTVLSQSGSWSYVEARQQPMLYNGTWSGYLGYVLSSQLVLSPYPKPQVSVVVPYAPIFGRSCLLNGCLSEDVVATVSFGTWLAVQKAELGWTVVILPSGGVGHIRSAEVSEFVSDEATIRATVVNRAHLLLGYIYSWGGRSAFSLNVFSNGDKQFTGLDCSGYASILYRSCGVIIPRDASKQALWTKNVTLSRLQPGDLYFFGIPGAPSSSSQYITHVMTVHQVANTPQLFESADNSTRILPITTAFGVPFNKLYWGMVLPPSALAPGEILSWGSLFPLRSWKWW